MIHAEEWKTRQIPKALAKTGAWLQDNVPFVEEPFIKPFMIDLADDHCSLLGWEPKHSLRETLPKMVETLKADPLGWYEANKLKPPSDLKEIPPEHRDDV